MAGLPLNIDELARRFEGQQRLVADTPAGPSAAETPLEHPTLEPMVGSPGALATVAPRTLHGAAALAAEEGGARSVTPVPRLRKRYARRRGRRGPSPSPFVLQPASAGGGLPPAGAQQPRLAQQRSSVRLGPSKRKLCMSPFAGAEDMERLTVRQCARRRVSSSGRRSSEPGPRLRSFLGPSRDGSHSAEPPPSVLAPAPVLRTSIASPYQR